MESRTITLKAPVSYAKRGLGRVRKEAGRLSKKMASLNRFISLTPKFQDQSLLSEYQISDSIVLIDGKVPLVWWTYAPNFGDLLSPWIFTKLTGRPAIAADKTQPHYFGVGSIAKYATPKSIVWGSGSFGTEAKEDFPKNADYRAVRGPLTETRIKYSGAKVPAIYGDPALLVPLLFMPRVKKLYDVGLVIRWNERKWLNAKVAPNVKLIDLRRVDIEGVLTDFLSCKSILSSSLHGLIIADAYDIPSAWLASKSPTGGGFKFYDHFLAVDKIRFPQHFDPSSFPVVTAQNIVDHIDFDDRTIAFDPRSLLDSCPLLDRV